jgi:MFS transporter, FHS family, L-fucose permease
MSTNNSTKNSYLIPFILVTSLFFMWGFASNLNGILIPQLHKALELSYMQSTFVDTALYLAYFIMAIPSGIILNKYGYKKGIVFGLLIFAIGAFLFLPAANTRTYEIFLIGLFILGCGLTLLETAANPYVTRLGSPEDASVRINFAQSFNGLAAFLAPIIGSHYIFSGKTYTKDQMSILSESDKIAYLTSEASSVKMPYIILGGFLIMLAILFFFVNLPELSEKKTETKKGIFDTFFKYSHVKWAVIAQFFYVGAQVCVLSFFVRVVMSGAGFDEKTAGYYLGIYGFLFMIGRFVGSALIKYFAASKLLSIYSLACIILSIAAISANGKLVVFALGGLGFFMSIMFPTIFSLGIVGLEDETKSASSLIVMAIIGGAIFPVIMGKIIDLFDDNLQLGYVVPLVCYFVVLYFGLVGHKVKSVTV